MNAELITGRLVRVEDGKFVIEGMTFHHRNWVADGGETTYDADLEGLSQGTEWTQEQWVGHILGQLGQWKIVNGVAAGFTPLSDD